MKVVHRLASVVRWLAVFSMCGAVGCGSAKPKEIVMVAAPNRLRNFTMAYLHATNALNRPPRNAEELKPYLTKIGDPKELLSSPRDGAEWIVHWGADLRKLPAQGDKSPVWLYEKNPHAGKRWVLRERNPMELADEEFRNSLFAPGFKPPF